MYVQINFIIYSLSFPKFTMKMDCRSPITGKKYLDPVTLVIVAIATKKTKPFRDPLAWCGPHVISNCRDGGNALNVLLLVK